MMNLKKHFSFMLLAAIGISLFTSCARELTPGERAEAFLVAMSEGDTEAARKMVSEEGESVILAVEKSDAVRRGKKAKIKIVEEHRKGDHAVIKYKYDDSRKVRTIHLQENGGEWEVVMDRHSNDIVIGEESLREILHDVDITLDEALSLSADAVDAALTVAGKTMEELGKLLQDVSKDVKINIEGSEDDLREAGAELRRAIRDITENIEINIDGSEEEWEEARREIRKALKNASKEISNNLEGSEEEIKIAKEEIREAMQELERALDERERRK